MSTAISTSATDTSATGFAGLNLEPALLDAVERLGYTQPTPIQEQAIPQVIAGRDVVGCAQTGTGKTAAFVLPILQRLGRGQGVRALVVTPTRELCAQIDEVARACCQAHRPARRGRLRRRALRAPGAEGAPRRRHRRSPPRAACST